MKIKNTLINFTIFVLSIYLPLLFYSAYSHYFTSDRGHPKVNKRKAGREMRGKIDAVSAGYLPSYFTTEIINKIDSNIFPIGTLPMTPTYLCDEGYGLITYKSDRFGLRNKDNKWNKVPKQSNIFIIGDSFIQGMCIPDSSTITNNVEKKTGVNTLSLGMGSNDPYDYMALLKTIVKPIIEQSKNNNKVIISFYINDEIFNNPKKEKLLTSANSIIEYSNLTVSPTYEYTKNIKKVISQNYPESKSKTIFYNKSYGFKHSAIYRVGTLLDLRVKVKILLGLEDKNFLLEQESFDLDYVSPSERSINLLAKICKNNCDPYVLIIPPSTYWNPPLSTGKLYINYKEKLKKFSNKNGIKFIDADELIDRNDINNYAPIGAHLSLEGNKKLADLISDNLSDVD